MPNTVIPIKNGDLRQRCSLQLSYRHFINRNAFFYLKIFFLVLKGKRVGTLVLSHFQIEKIRASAAPIPVI